MTDVSENLTSPDKRSSERFLRDLHRFFPADQEQAERINRVRTRLLAHAAQKLPVQSEGSPSAPEPVQHNAVSQRRSALKRHTQSPALGTIAAVLVVALLIGAFLAVFSSVRQSSTAGPSKSVTSAHPLTLTFSCYDSPGMGFFVLGGSQGRVCVQTAPKAQLRIVVTLCNGPADSSPVLKGTVRADESGYYEWNWRVHSPCGPHPGRGTAMVTAQLDGQFISQSTSFFGD